MLKNLFAVTSLLLTSTFSFADALPSEPHFYVKGYSQQYVQPDEVVFNMAITHTDKNIKNAKAEVDKVINRAIKVATKFNVSKNDIDAAQFNVRRETRYNRQTQQEEFVGFRVVRDLKFKLTDINKYADILQALVDTGINEIGQAQFSYSKQAEVKSKLRKLAIKDAKLAAKELAKEFDTSLKEVYSVSFHHSPSNPAPYERQVLNMYADSAAPYKESYNTSDMLISSEVFVTYLIEQ